ncbi:MAG: lysophospholipid acyltransferase family protein [bacterium]
MVYYLLSLLFGLALIPVYAGGSWGWGLVWQVPLALLTGIVSFLLLFLLFISLVSLTIDPEQDYERPTPFYQWMIGFAFDYVLFLCGVRLRVEGREQVPAGTFFLVANHLAFFDPLILMAALRRRDLVFVSKPENFSLPVIGRYMRRCRHLAIDREDPRKAIRTINEAIDLIRQDIVAVGIFPEGTRSKTGALGEFKNGCFRIAQKAKGHPMVVCAIENSQMISKHFFLLPTRVTVRVKAVLPYEAIEGKRTGDLSDEVRALMES